MKLTNLARRVLPCVAVVMLLLAPPNVFAEDRAVCDATPADQVAVVETMRAMYAAATADDLEKMHSVTTADFYAFDGGKRFDGDALFQLVKSAHAAGTVFVWTVTEPEVHVSCNEGDVAGVCGAGEGERGLADPLLP
jgi:hypothetical protein